MAELLELPNDSPHEYFYEAGWTDGFPVVVPTPDRVLQMLLAAGISDPAEIVGTVPQRNATLSTEMVAINAVMAGCQPEYFRVVLAAVAAMLDPAFNANGACTSSGGAALCCIVSGPIASAVGMNSSNNALASGNRANATIGRSLRLVAINLLGARSPGMDASSLGNPGKYSLCFAEETPPAPWDPFRVALGYREEDTTVTVLPTEGPRQVANHLAGDVTALLSTFAASMRDPGAFITGKRGQGVVVLGYEHRAAIIGAGWTRRQVQEFLFRHSRISPAELQSAGIPVVAGAGEGYSLAPDDDGLFPSMASPDDVFVVTAGGPGAGWSAYIPEWAPPGISHASAVTRRVSLPGEGLPSCGADGCEVSF